MIENTKYIVDKETDQTLLTQCITIPSELTLQQWNLQQNLINCTLHNTPQLKIINYIVKHINENGLVILSPIEIHKDTNIPITTISRILTRLQLEQPTILIKKLAKQYQINPIYITETFENPKINGILYTSTNFQK